MASHPLPVSPAVPLGRELRQRIEQNERQNVTIHEQETEIQRSRETIKALGLSINELQLQIARVRLACEKAHNNEYNFEGFYAAIVAALGEQGAK